jgi:hypothetical protein
MFASVDWTTVASLATAAGTLVLAIATFASVRSANNAARTAERALEVGLVPLLFPSRLEDGVQRIRWGDDHWASIDGGRATMELVDGNLYLAMSLRNVGSGTAVLHAWRAEEVPAADLSAAGPMTLPAPAEFRAHTRDLFIPAGDVSFWQAAIRDRHDPLAPVVGGAIADHRGLLIDVLYSDYEGGQRTISRFMVVPDGEGSTGWLASVVRHWNLDRPDPRG